MTPYEDPSFKAFFFDTIDGVNRITSHAFARFTVEQARLLREAGVGTAGVKAWLRGLSGGSSTGSSNTYL